jgi:prevent-host-death family protein
MTQTNHAIHLSRIRGVSASRQSSLPPPLPGKLTPLQNDHSNQGAGQSDPAQDAKACFSELLDTCEREGPQVVSPRGRETAVLVPVEDWRRLQAAARPSLKELLLAPEARTEELVPARGQARRRGVVEL